MPTVGETLAAERRRQGKSLQDVVEATKIRSRMIDALENGRYAQLPDSAYVKGYIQSYARYLEIPAGPLLDQYRVEAASTPHTSPSDRYLNVIPHETIVPDRERAHAIPRQVWLVAVGVLIVASLLICGLARLFSGGGTNLPAPAKSAGSSDVTASPGTATTTTVAAQPTGFLLRITVKKGQASWVNVTVDGLQAYDGTLNSGDSREWRVSGTAILKAGKPTALAVTRDGAAVTIPKGGAVSQVTLSATQ